jgi:hypothetical protein
MIGATASASFDSRLYWVIPFDGTPSDWDRFQKEILNLLRREFQHGDAGHVYSLKETLMGTDIYGAVVQANPATAALFRP